VLLGDFFMFFSVFTDRYPPLARNRGAHNAALDE
jgi:hypothetical protein